MNEDLIVSWITRFRKEAKKRYTEDAEDRHTLLKMASKLDELTEESDRSQSLKEYWESEEAKEHREKLSKKMKEYHDKR